MRLPLAAVAVLGTATLFIAATFMAPPPPPGWKVIAWSDSGMQWIDPDYSVFSLFPPADDLRAQVISPTGALLQAPGGVTVSYEAVADASGSINRTSGWKTNFWQHASTLYGGSATPDSGLAGFNMPGPANTPRAMAFDPVKHEFKAEDVPITPYDDGQHFRPYPMLRLVARDAAGAPLASTDVVAPVSDEMGCYVCHASGTGTFQPFSGWSWNPNRNVDYRLNILGIHDDFNLGQTIYQNALAARGYSQSGLRPTAQAGTPVRCAGCHASNAFPGTGIAGITPLTQAMHTFHAFVFDPQLSTVLGFSTDRSACYRCHPGPEAKALRGPMGRAVAADGSRAIQCQGCHGVMTDVGTPGRQGWLDLPACQNCHTGTALNNNGQLRYTSAFEPNGLRRVAVDPTYATNPDVPSAGVSLYRASTGHGGLACAACHGAQHGEGPSAMANDNVQNQTLQGHAGMLIECLACHATMPQTVTGGPHGLHPVGQTWISDHEDVPSAQIPACRACHGTDYRGTVLSRTQAARTFSTEFGTKTFFDGAQISCYACHNGPTSDTPTTNHRPTVQNATGSSTAGASAPITLVGTDPDSDPLTFRIVSQPAHGAVGVVGNVATYYPDPGFAGPDTFTFAAWDGKIDSNLGTVTVTRGAEWESYGIGIPGKNNKVPTLVPTAAPVLGTTIGLYLENTSGAPTLMAILLSEDRAHQAAGFGGTFLAEPANALLAPLPATGLVIDWQIPNVPSLTGFTIYGQLIEVDPAAHFQIAFSRGLRLTLGP